MKVLLTLVLVFSFCNSAISQYNSSLSHNYLANIEKEMHEIGVRNHTSIKPLKLSQSDSSFYQLNSSFNSKSIVLNNFLNDNLLFVKTDDYELYLNPLFHFEIGNDAVNRYINSRGIELKGRIGNKTTFYTAFHELQAFTNDYIQQFILNNQFVLPGQGMVKRTIFLEDSIIDLYHANAYVNYNASQFFNIEFGHGKHFFGDGYRSLLLSDNAFNYPYFKLTTTFWRLKYVNLFSSMQHIDWDRGYDISKKKFSAIHYLSANIGSRLTINLFESIMLGEDSLGHVFDVNYLNPIIFYRPVEYSIGYSRHGNAVMGLGLKYKLTNLAHLYGQFLLDEFTLKQLKAQNGYWANKYGGQIGFKCFDLFGFDNLSLQSELNVVRPFTYSHLKPILNYAHFAQPLAHPFGASFIENVTIIRYRKDRWSADLKIVLARLGAQLEGDTTNYGSDIFYSYNQNRNDFGNEIAQGNTTHLQHTDVRIGYLINPLTNLKLELGITNRLAEDLTTNSKNQYLFFSLKSDLSNTYNDF